jgi:uncharacterized glyoxalase superfamily protein PhnB
MAVKPIPDGYHTVTPYVMTKDADQVLDFMKRALGAAERFRMDDGGGKIMHAEVQIGDSVVMIAEATDKWQPMPACIHLYVEDCDAIFQRAVEAGAEVVQELADQFYGDRSGGVRDSGGNLWWITSHVEDVDAEEIARRASERDAQNA